MSHPGDSRGTVGETVGYSGPNPPRKPRLQKHGRGAVVLTRPLLQSLPTETTPLIGPVSCCALRTIGNMDVYPASATYRWPQAWRGLFSEIEVDPARRLKLVHAG